MMNARGGMGETPAAANFGNCNAVILRCATPKCANGACYDMSVARPIVAGCVNSNNSCKKYGDDLIEYITAQVVAQSTAKQQEQANAVAIAQAQAEAQAAAAQTAAAQSTAQMQAMQQQMAEMQAQMAESMAAMQEQMAAQTESQSAQIQTLAEQRNSYYSDDGAANGNNIDPAALEGLSVVEQLGVKNNIDPNLLVREQVSGKIETAITDAEIEMKTLKQKLDDLLEYAGCDSAATNCTGPKRVKKFKDLANQFFDPYEGVVDNMYNALLTAMTVGIDVNDVIMLLSDSCNMWGQYLCEPCTGPTHTNTETDNSKSVCECRDTTSNNCYWRVATKDGKVSKNQPHCRLMKIMEDKESVQREWIEANTGLTGSTQVACASDVVLSAALFRGRSKQATMDIETLRDLVNQDSTGTCQMSNGEFKNGAKEACGMYKCIVDYGGGDAWDDLTTAVSSKKLPSRGKGLCYRDYRTYTNAKDEAQGTEVKQQDAYAQRWLLDRTLTCGEQKDKNKCNGTRGCKWDTNIERCVDNIVNEYVNCLKYNSDNLTGDARKAACEKEDNCKFDEDVWECDFK